MLDVGSSCEKTAVVRRLDASNSFATCPAGYTEYLSAGGAVKCFPSCPPADGTTLDGSGQCKPNACWTDESSTSGAVFPRVTSLPATAQSAASAQVDAFFCDRAASKAVRRAEFPQCPAGKEYSFLSALGAVISGSAYPSSSDLSLVSPASVPNYADYFSCTASCPSGWERAGNFCVAPCPAGPSGETSFDADAPLLDGEVPTQRCKRYFNQHVDLLKSGAGFPSGTADASAGCAPSTAAVPRWKDVSSVITATTPSNTRVLFQLDATSPSGSLWPGGDACVSTAGVCPSGTAPVGFSETPSSVRVYCSPLGSTCGSLQPDAEFANVCLRAAQFVDPQTEAPNVCGAGFALWMRSESVQPTSLTYSHAGEQQFDPSAMRVRTLVQQPRLYDPALGVSSGEIVAFDYEPAAPLRVKPPFFRARRAVPPGTASLPVNALFASAGGAAPPVGATIAPLSLVVSSLPTVESVSGSASADWSSLLPTTVDVANTRLAGSSELLRNLCTADGFCPPLCLTPLSRGDSASGVGLREPVIEKDAGGVWTAYSYARCGPSSAFDANGRYCISKGAPQTLPTYPGKSFCANGTQPIRDAGVPRCYEPCASGSSPAAESAVDARPLRCITQCPATEWFVESGDSCVKVPYQRALAAGSSGYASVGDAQTALEADLGEDAATASKFLLYGGTRGVLSVAGVILGVSLLLALVLLGIKKQRVALEAAA
jgi:hypothetical protein